MKERPGLSSHPDCRPRRFAAPFEKAAPRRTGLLWAIGPRNPLVRLEWFGWKRHFARQLVIGLLFLAAISAVYALRSGGFPPGSTGYSNALYRAVRGSAAPGGAGRVSRARRFWAGVIVNFERGLVRLTTLLPWLLIIRSVGRIRRLGMWDSLRMTFLTARDWVAGLAGPPIFLATLALAAFLSGPLLRDFLNSYANLPEEIRRQYRLALVGTLPFIGLEGAANGLLVAGVTLHEALRSRRASTVAGRSLAWILGIELAHALAIFGLATLALDFQIGRPYPWRMFVSNSFQLTAVAAVKGAAGLVLLWQITRTLPARLQQEAEARE